MGRAQVVQAGACKVDPDVRMNPVLLKPNSDTGSQVILEGKPIGNIKALDYYEYKRKLWKSVTGCYDSLSAEYDVIVLEGAGSPGEVNLKAHDIVNMRMAEYADAPVLLTGDIDRGGVFASFIGTLGVMEEWERSLIAGFLVNKFRGDASLLRPAYEYVVNYTGKQVIGTIPYLRDLGLPEEDSVSFKEELYRNRDNSGSQTAGQLTIYVVDLPHISNFTDIDPLRGEPDVSVYIISSKEEIDRLAPENPPDAVIIPGSKNVIKDLQFLQSMGISESLKHYGTCSGTSPEIVGICGGFQMLGNTIRDPYGIESDEEQIEGLGLLDIDTVLARDKTLAQTTGRHLDTGLPVKGYEIHHGRTKIRKGRVIIEMSDSVGGVASPGERVWGTYLHGIFDSDEFRHYFLEKLRGRKGLPPLTARPSYDLESAFERLADTVRKSVDIGHILEIIGIR
jgi:cobyric acid synthase CobQ